MVVLRERVLVRDGSTPSLTFVIRSQHINKGEGVIAANQSGSRDESVFPHADRFDIHRQGTRSKPALGFGYGPHRCQAEWLSRAELEIVFGTPSFFQTPSILPC